MGIDLGIVSDARGCRAGGVPGPGHRGRREGATRAVARALWSTLGGSRRAGRRRAVMAG